ncbi:MAG TPA: CdaR family protein [Clostridia bacterium]|nr:MAG: YbbR-like protein [Firmicutes bacterium ADurb.Bin146]HOD93799.1 CdaR family protein [Clostridia bacterium]
MWSKLKKNLFFKVLAVVIAIIIWFIVSVNNNPVEVKTISIPIQIQNERNLTLRNLKIVNSFDNFIDIQIKGAATEVSKVVASDFSAYVDYTEIINENVTELTVKGINYNGNAKITFSNKEEDAKKIIKVERITSSEFPVTVKFNGALMEGYELVAYSVTPNIQSISDVTSMIVGIGSIQVDIDLDNATQSFTLRKACVVYDKSMRIMNEYTNTITVDVNVIIGKKVNISSRLSGTSDLNENYMYISNSLEYSQAIIVGDNSVIKDINTIYTKTVDISGKTESFAYEAELDVPSNIRVYTINNVLNANNKVRMNIIIEQLITKKFEFGIEELTIRNKNILQEYTLKEDIFSLTLKGRALTISTITKEQITPYIDVLNLDDGAKKLKVNILSLGSNITLSDSSVLEVYIETIATYSIDSSKIVLTNVDNNLSYFLQAETFNMKLVGLGNDISNTDISEMKFYINVQDLTEGMHIVDVIVRDSNLPQGVRLYEDIQIAVNVTRQ